MKYLELVKSETHSARRKTFELNVYRVVGSGQLRVHISNADVGRTVLATAESEVVSDAAAMGTDIVEILIRAAKDDIDANTWGIY
jgi:hypothetical protein